jgi:hypothetical protein
MNIIDTPLQPVSVFLRSSSYTTMEDKSNLIFELNTPIHSYPNMDILVSLDSFQFTNSFYTINENNRYFYYSYDVGFTFFVFTLTMGNYDIDSLLSYMNTLMTGFFTFTYDISTFKITITSSDNRPFRLLGKTSFNCFEILGFDTSGTTSDTTSCISPYMFNLMSTQVLHITSPNININSVSVKNTRKYNILSSVHVNCASGETQTYMNTNCFKYKISDYTIPSINICILNQDFDPVYFNNIDWFLNINFTFIYKKEFILPTYLHNMNTDSNISVLEQEEDRNIYKYLDDIDEEKKKV